MKTKKLFGIMAVTAVLAMFAVLSLTGCGNDDAPGNGNGNSNNNDNDNSSGNGVDNGAGDGGWTAVTGIDTQITAIVFGNGKFVAAFRNRMRTSTDGITWTAETDFKFGGSNEVHAIARGSDKFVAVGSNGKISYSPDGITWTAVPMTNNPFYINSNTIYAIAYGGGRFVAGSSSGKAAYSSDGITWTPVTISSFTSGYIINAIVYGNGMFIAGGNGEKMAYSTDGGETWTDVDTGGVFSYLLSGYTLTGAINTITYNNGMFVAGGDSGKMAYSTNGISWMPADTGSLFDYTLENINDRVRTDGISVVAYGNGKYVAGGGFKAAASSDGITWTASDIDRIFYTESLVYIIAGIAYGNGRFVAISVNYSGGKIAYLLDD